MASTTGIFRSEPDNPRQSMEPSDMSPDEARAFVRDLMTAIHQRLAEMPDEKFESPNRGILVSADKAKQHYGKDKYLFLSGIQAALREWDESGRNTEELKEEYGGRFVDGVELGERLAVYQESDFEFTAGDDESDDSDSKFTFTEAQREAWK